MASPCQQCILCKKEFTSAPTVIYKKGYETILRASKERNDDDLTNDLMEMHQSSQKILVHFDCRRKYTDTRRRSGSGLSRKKLRSSVEMVFDWKGHCFLCGTEAHTRHQDRDPIVKVMTLPLRSTLVERAKEREDDWGKEVLYRLESCNDLVAEEAVYHNSCMTKFRLKSASSNKKGKPVDEKRLKGFQNLCHWLEEEGDSELYTIKELQEKMKDSYTPQYLKTKLKEQYKEHIYFSELQGRSDVLCFTKLADYIIEEKKKKRDETKEDIISAAAKIIKAEIRELGRSNEKYPTLDDIQNTDQSMDWIPPSLQLFLSHLIPDALKRLSLGQCLMQAARPRSLICPVLFGLGVQLEKSFGSKWLVNNLAKFGFSVTADEVLRYKQSAIDYSTKNTEVEEEFGENTPFMQWVADNVDHNIVTLTGKGTFHGMGVISIKNSNSRFSSVQAIKRLKERPLAASFIEHRGIPIHPYIGSSTKGLLTLKLKPILHVQVPFTSATEVSYNMLWHSARYFSTSSNPQPSWSGFMQDITKMQTAGTKAEISFLPIIDLNPSDENCIYSTLVFIIKQARQLHINIPCVTFDQPLWLKATGIIAEAKLDIVARLGGFHTVMSFLGSIGKVMKGSGIEELFAVVYAELSVEHMMTGKAVSRALRAHFLAESALTCMLFKIVEESKDIDLSPLKQFLDQLHEEDIETVNAFCQSEEASKLSKAAEEIANKLAKNSRTAKLWLDYLQWISTVKSYIIAERTSNWHLHLQSSIEMLNLFAASGHIHYAKSARFYVQQMQSLQLTHPWLYDQFSNGQHAVRRSSRYWAGLWSDLVIEQTLMRSIKTRGGLTRGRGMTESVRHMWALSLNHTAAVHDAMISLSGLNIKTSEQHIDMRTARRVRDYDHWQKFKMWLEDRNPFTYQDPHLHSLATGFKSVKGNDEVNCDQAEELGWLIQQKLDDMPLATASIKRKDQVKPLDSMQNTVKINEVSVYINSTVLFTRLAAVAKREDDEEQFFAFELTTEPMALFAKGMMRKPDKPSLRKALVSDEDAIKPETINNSCVFVIDGGALLHRVYWIKDMTFRELAQLYVDYVRRHYGNAHVVFDGYEGASTKGSEQSRRNGGGQKCPDVEVKERNKVPFLKERFLSNIHNKEQLIQLISTCLKDDGQIVINCTNDADTMIVSTALELGTSSENPIVVVADDTDIIIMLLYHWTDAVGDLIFFQQKVQRGWNIKDVNPKIEEIKEHLLFIHAMSGCDTTSAPFGKGKGSLLKLVKKSEELRNISATMSDVWAEPEDISKSSIRAFALMFGGNISDSLTNLRYKKYLHMACKGTLEPAKLPPTDRAAHYHGLRVHHQIVTWKVLDNVFELRPEDWGWHCKDDALYPTMTDLQVAPECLMKVVRCYCKSSSKTQCGSNLCTCRKHGLKCGDCQGESCFNKNEDSDLEYDEANDEIFPHDDVDIEDRNIFDDILVDIK